MQEMESLCRIFRPSLFVVCITTFICLVIELFIGVLLPFESLAFGNFIVSIAAITLFGSLCMLFTRLELNADGNCFSLIVRLFKATIIRKDIKGSAWHGIARPGRSFDSSPSRTTFYRIEVTDLEDKRTVVLGESIAFLYGVECL